MGKVFTLEDVKELAKHMSPVLDNLTKVKDEDGVDEPLKIWIWKDSEVWVEPDKSDKWRIIKRGDSLTAEFTTKEAING